MRNSQAKVSPYDRSMSFISTKIESRDLNPLSPGIIIRLPDYKSTG
jgi:hypothetical protein